MGLSARTHTKDNASVRSPAIACYNIHGKNGVITIICNGNAADKGSCLINSTAFSPEIALSVSKVTPPLLEIASEHFRAASSSGASTIITRS